nr:ribonuclease H-like domain-containing protein [Tanacetum cinerariifolium]
MKLSSVNQWTKILIFPVLTKFKTPQYPKIHPPSQEISDEVFQAKGDLMESIQIFLEEFNYIPFGEKPKILLQAWYKFFAIRHAQPEDSNELFHKLLEDLQIINKELIECNRPTFFNDNEDHSIQNKEYLENSSKEIASSNSNQEKEGPPQDFDIRQLIREECCIEVCEEQKQNMEDTILELVEICRQKEVYFMHDNVDDLIKSALNFKLLLINSQRLNKEKQEVKNVEGQPAECRTQPEYSPSMGYEHPNTTLETKSDEIIKSGVEELVPILNENEVTSEDKKECDMLVCENSPICDNHSEIFSDSNNDDDISSDDDAFEDIEYVEASFPDLEIVSVEEENVVYHEEEEFDLEEIQDVILREKLLSINRLVANIESLNDNPTPDRMLNSSVSILIFEESDNSLSDNFSPEFETFCDHTEETRSDITTTHAHDSLPEYDSFCFEIKPDQERLINIVKNDISDDSTNDPLLEEFDLFLAFDNSIPPGIENFAYDSEGDIRFLEELLSDDSIPFPVNESSESDFDNLSIPRPPSEPRDAEFDFEPNAGEEISVVMNTIDELECLDPRDKFNVSNNEDDDYLPFMLFIQIFLPYLICSKMFISFLSAESEDTIFDPVIEFPLPEEVPITREESSHCQKKIEATAVKIALLLKSRRNYSYEVPATAASTATTGTTSDETELWAAILKTFGGNEATKKTKKNLLKQQYGNFKAEGSETLEQMFNRLQNMDFISSAKHNRGNEDVNTASVFTASTNVPTTSANIGVASISQNTACAYIASQSSGSQIKFEDINQIDKDDMEEMDIKLNMALLSMKADKFWKKTGKKISIQGTDVAGFDKSKVECFNCHKMGHFARKCRAPKSQDRGRRDNYRQGSKVKEQALKALMEIDENMICHYKLGLAQVESRLAEHKDREIKYYEKIRDLDSLLESQRLDKNKEGLGYSVVPPLTTQIYSPPKKDMSWTGLPEFKDDIVTNYSRPAPTIGSSSDDAQNRNPSVTKTEASPSTISPKSFIKFVKANDSPNDSKTDKAKTAKKPHIKYAEQNRKPTKKPNGSSQNNIDDKGYWDISCSRHMTDNISYFFDYEPFDGGYVSFGQGGCKITGKRTIKTGKLEFENMYFVKDLKTPRQHNLYSIDLNNIVPYKDLTCLVAKASADEEEDHQCIHRTSCLIDLLKIMLKLSTKFVDEFI